MNTDQTAAMHTVTLLLHNPDARAAVGALVEAHGAFTLAPQGGAPAGLVLLELGPDADGGFARMARLQDAPGVTEVFLAAPARDPECILRAMRAGVDEFLPWPVQPQDLRAALDRYLARRGAGQNPRPQAPRGRIIHVLGPKGGTGATTVAVNTAVEAARLGGPGSTALLDARPTMGEAPLFLDLDCPTTWAEAGRNLARLDATFMESLMVRHASGLDVLAAPLSLEDAGAAGPEAARAVAGLLRRMYPTVVVDGGPFLDEVALALLAEADEIVMVLVLSLPCLAGVRRMLDAFRGLDPALEGRVRLVVNRHLSRAEIGVAEAEELLGRPVAWKIPNDYEAAMAAVNQGRPLAEAAPRSQAARALAALAADLAPAAPARCPAPAGLLGRLLGRPGRARMAAAALNGAGS